MRESRDDGIRQELATGVAYGKGDDETQCAGSRDSVLRRDW
jgi:hypothetical protein